MSNVKNKQVPVHDAADKEAIHADVRSYYGARAQAVGTSCCEPSSDGQCCDNEAIRVDVLDDVSARTQAVDTGCCEPGSGAGDGECCDMGARLYSAEELAQAPDDAGASSLGCGNPTALASLRPGEVVGAGRPVLALLPPGNMKLRFFVPEALLPRVSTGLRVTISCDGCTKRYSARISFISREAEFTPPVIYSLEERAKLVFRVEARPDEPEALRVGQPVTVDLTAAPAKPGDAHAHH